MTPRDLLLRYKEWGVLIVMMILATIITDGMFITLGNLTDMLRSIAPVFVMALAMTLVILAAGIDLSVGSILALASVGTAVLLTRATVAWPPALSMTIALLFSLLLGGVVGAVQGGLIARLNIQPFVITLAGMIGARGLAKLWSNNNRIGLGDAADRFGEIFSSKSVMIGILILVAVLFHLLLQYTVFGRNIRAVGDNEQAARYAGLPVLRVKLWVYTLSGMMAGLAGLMMCARTRTGDANSGIAYELDAIAMVVIGGTSLMGGRGNIGGTVLGALILGTVINVLGLKNVDANVQFILKAVIIVVAVALQQAGMKQKNT